jgi:ketopantoate reductase
VTSSSASASRPPVSVVPAASAGEYDLVLAAVRADQLKAACAQLTDLAGRPAVVLFGNNPGGRSTVGGMAGERRQGFPGIGGVLRGLAICVSCGRRTEGCATWPKLPVDELALIAGSLRRTAEASSHAAAKLPEA